MMFAAKQVEEIYNGVFPNQYHDIIKLKGIGPYTAAAISSFAFGLPYAVVDGNVSRVLSRYYGIHTPINSHQGKKIFSELAQENLNHKDPATYNQAIMEFGSLQCKPANPNCAICPLSNSCIALSSNSISLLPKKEKKLKISNKYLHFFFIQKHNQFLIEKRDNNGIWKGLYQLPLIETKQDEDLETVFRTPEFTDIIGKNDFLLKSVQKVNHKLTHLNLFIRFYQVEISEFAKLSYLRVNMSDLQSLAFPRPIEKYLEAFKRQ
jgi:A/G-specific adenine glycosylase